MNTLSWLMNDSLSARLTISLIHFLWQGCLAASVVIAGEFLLRKNSARLRYALNVTVMLLMAACLPITFGLVHSDPSISVYAPNTSYGSFSRIDREETDAVDRMNLSPPNLVVNATSDTATTPAPDLASQMETGPELWSSSFFTELSSIFPLLSKWITILYLTGVIVVLSRLGHGLLGGHRLRKFSTPVAESALLNSVRKLAHQVGLKTIPAVAWCKQISVPVVVGVMRPMILLPMEVVSGLTPHQLEALLLHELSHIRRFDPAVNLLQRVVESILFFHPAVWFVSRRVSLERENAADDMVLETGWDRPNYADALVRVAEISASVLSRKAVLSATVLQASGASSSEFKLRVLRLLNSHPPKLDVSWSAMLVAALFVGLSGVFVYSYTEFGETPSEFGQAATALPEQEEASKPALRISGQVFDAETGDLIEKCRMVPTMSDREETTNVTWQTQYLKEFSDGRFVYETDRPWAKTRLRIEAEGYEPAITPYVNKGEVVEVNVKLERKVLTGIVRLPDGKPADGAQIALATWTNEIKVDDGELSYHGHGSKLRRIIETDEQGYFAIPAEVDSSVLIVAHPQGYAEYPNAEISLARRLSLNARETSDASAKDTPLIMLEPWGRVEGRVMLGNKPVVGAKYWISQARNDDFHVWSHTNVETVGDGRFEVEHVPPGRFGTCQRYVDGSDGTSSYSLNGLMARFEVAAGKTVSLSFGSRTLVGKLVANGLQRDIDWSKSTLHIALQPPRIMGHMGGMDESTTLWSRFLETEEGMQYTPKKFSIDADGSFRIEGLPPAQYDLQVHLKEPDDPQGAFMSGSEKMTVPADVTMQEDRLIDLGTIPVKLMVVWNAQAAIKENAAIQKLSDLWQKFDTLHKSMTQQFQALNASQRLVQVSENNVKAGNGAKDAAKDNLRRAKQSHVFAVRNYLETFNQYHQVMVDIYALKCTLVAPENIEFQEGLWFEKIYRRTHTKQSSRDQSNGKTEAEFLAASMKSNPSSPEFLLPYLRVIGFSFDLTEPQLSEIFKELNLEFPENPSGEDQLRVILERSGLAIAAAKQPGDPNLPWRAYGRVVDKDGKPLAGVTVRAATGVGTLLGGGSGVTGKDGRYDFQFGKGITIVNDKDGKPSPQTQYALISASFAGHFEKNFNRQGNGIASLEDVDEAGLKHWSVKADQVCTPNKPRQLDFVMLPAAKVAGTLIDENNRPLADYSVALSSSIRSPGAEVLAQVVTDSEGKFAINDIPTTIPYQFEIRKPRLELRPPWDDSWASGLISFEEPGDNELAARVKSTTGDSKLAVKSFRMKIVGPGIGGKQAIKRAEKQNLFSEIEKDGLNAKVPSLESWTITLSNDEPAS